MPSRPADEGDPVAPIPPAVRPGEENSPAAENTRHESGKARVSNDVPPVHRASAAAPQQEAAKPVIPLDDPEPPQPDEPAPEPVDEIDSRRRFRLRERFLSVGVSAAVHATLLVVLAMISIAATSGTGGIVLHSELNAQPDWQPEDIIFDPTDAKLDFSPGDLQVDADSVEVNVAEFSQAASGPDASQSYSGVISFLNPDVDLAFPIEKIVGGGLQGRSPENRPNLAMQDGGTRESEAAVEAGLRWLAAHQLENGGWSFDFTKSYCGGLCSHPGNEPSTTGATGLALLPFLGAGYTHLDGEHRDVVRRGLYYLMQRGRVTEHGVDLQEGTMYAQGIATLAVCEAYAMTGDKALEDFAQGAVDFIVYAQDRKGGGWRYSPGEPGDTTVTGWQLMALKSAELGRLQVPRDTLYLAQHFLDRVQSEDGALYGYLKPDEPRPATTAVGLLCRMYGGWTRYEPGLQKGVAVLSHWGPSASDMYYNYYATQVMRHWNGPGWPEWNRRLRDYLVENQSRTGHEAGSWYFEDPHVSAGGRLYTTALAIMILEVYYRYMPLYGRDVFQPQSQ
ncbi:terpene cyclase/mutase family protein [Thermostilla marina]